MVKLIVGKNDAGQRLDRFLRKYLKRAPLGMIYRFIRKDIKVNGKRTGREYQLQEADEIFFYLPEEVLESLTGEQRGYDDAMHPVKGRNASENGKGDAANGTSKTENGKRKSPKNGLVIVYENEDILLAAKPAGLLTHGDEKEKKHTLVNQVVDYLIAAGAYVPRLERSFTPASVNRLDRNTTGLVLFGKNAAALRALNAMIRTGDAVSKYYLTVLTGELRKELHLTGTLVKDAESNTVSVRLTDAAASAGGDAVGASHTMPAGEVRKRDADSHKNEAPPPEKQIETIARPLAVQNGFTLAEIELITGRTHQIRAHMAKAGFPVLGDPKYGNPAANRSAAERFGLRAQLLHAHRLFFHSGAEPLQYLAGKEFRAGLPPGAAQICRAMFCDCKIDEFF